MEESGYPGVAVTIKSDQEPAIKSFRSEVTRRRTAVSFPEEAMLHSSQSNGFVERAVQSVEGQIRVLKDALEARVGCVLTGPRAGEPVLSWLVEYASVLLNRYEVAKDGKTAYERLRGKKSKVLGLVW